MSLQLAAQHLASKGRDGDSVLVHMTPGEVRGLQELAMANGGELTINPETGLPEANFLKALLPTIIGAALAPLTAGTSLAFLGTPLGAGLAVGGVEALRTGDLGKGLMAGFGAYGGANLAGALASAGTSAAVEGARASIPAIAEGDVARLMLETGADKDVVLKQLQREAIEKATTDAARSSLGGSFSDRAMAGLQSLKGEAGRTAFMDALGGAKGAIQTASGIAGPIVAAQDMQSRMPKTVTQMTSPTARITPYRIDQFGNIASAGSHTPQEFAEMGGFSSLYGPPPGAAEGGLMGMASGGVAFESGTTPSYQRTSMSPGMLDFADRSEPVVRMAEGGFTDERVAQALRESMGQGFSLEQSLGGAASKFGISQDQLTRAQALLNPPPSAPAAGLQAAAASIAPPATITSTDPTQQALPTAAQYAAQQSIVADPVAAARQAAVSGIAAGMTDQQIADMVNMQYGKTFNAQNVADFMKTQGITRPAPVLPPKVPVIPVTPTPDLFPGTTPGVVSTGDPFAPTAPTMEQVRSAYVQGGGRTDMPTITNIQPTDRTYTQNEAFGLLQGYLKSNPNAMYRDVVAFANSRGIPEMQARAAYNEFRFSGLTGGSSQAYDYLMGRGAYPIKPYVPGGGPIMRSYREVMGLPTGYEGFKPVKFTSTPSGAKISEQQRSELGNAFVNAQKTNDYSSFNTMLQDLKLTAEDLLKLYPSLTREGIKEQVDKGYIQFANPYVDERESEGSRQTEIGGGASGGVAQDIPNMARGGLSSLAILGAAKGGGFNLGDYSDGGRLLRGPGDGVSDSIPATIGGKRPARLADGEFVVPARIVSELGNGSTEAGARKLYAMMDRVQAARKKSIGKGKVAKNSRADKYLPA